MDRRRSVITMIGMSTPDRRSLLAAGGGLALCASSLVAQAQPQKAWSAAEQRRLKLVNDFCALWASPKPDIDAMVASYMADDCVVHVINGQLSASGKAGAATLFKGWMEDGRRFELKVLSSAVFGPIVINTRIDTTFSPGAAPFPAPIVGVFFVSGAKIKEWSDYDNV